MINRTETHLDRLGDQSDREADYQYDVTRDARFLERIAHRVQQLLRVLWR